MSIYKQNFLSKDIVFLFLFFHVCIISCSHKISGQAINYSFKSKTHLPDYSDLNYWAASPFKYDPSDNIPTDMKDRSKDSLADVFFIYPTSYIDRKMPDGWNADIDDQAINKKTDETSILYQASVFNKYCRVFVPRYRQANLYAFYTSHKDSGEAALDLAYEDVRNAFEYYLQNYNRGRPIIIASHSQGTWHAGKLLKEFFEGKPLQKQLVCAYIIGLPVFTNYFSKLNPCSDSTATGCFVSWRTFQEGYEAPYIQKETLKAYVINPLTWTMDTTLAPASLNKGGVLRNFNKVIPGVVHAQIHGNVLWVNKPQFLGSVFIKTKNFHIADYNLFYENIRENVGTRIKCFLKNQ
ncbi:MAG TPA: DUF3089 domain-containing protein [Hanamia sp.]|nr:DUF3089 domain-containing protein [Hanamia sp.]